MGSVRHIQCLKIYKYKYNNLKHLFLCSLVRNQSIMKHYACIKAKVSVYYVLVVR